MLMTVSTDGRFWRQRGSTVYGVGRFDDRLTFSESITLFHGVDERISVESVMQTARFYVDVIAAYFGNSSMG